MLCGQATVFLSCSEKYKLRFAVPDRALLADRNIRGVIVSEEPMLPHATNDPSGKVELYLDASDSFGALCTPDDRLADGPIHPRDNIVVQSPEFGTPEPNFCSRLSGLATGFGARTTYLLRKT